MQNKNFIRQRKSNLSFDCVRADQNSKLKNPFIARLRAKSSRVELETQPYSPLGVRAPPFFCAHCSRFALSNNKMSRHPSYAMKNWNFVSRATPKSSSFMARMPEWAVVLGSQWSSFWCRGHDTLWKWYLFIQIAGPLPPKWILASKWEPF